MDNKIKVVYYDQENNLAIESLWATQEGEFYRIKNIPFFAPNLSYNDLVKVELDANELYFDELIEASGHSTLQIFFFRNEIISKVQSRLIELGCSWEGSHKENYISVDIPRIVGYNSIKTYLDRLESQNKLSYREACLAHTYVQRNIANTR